MNKQDPIIEILQLALEVEQDRFTRDIVNRSMSARSLKFISEAHRLKHEGTSEEQVDEVIQSLAKLINAVDGVTAAIKK